MTAGFSIPGMAGAQKLGRSLMLPIAVLPIAGLMLRLGQEDLLDISFIAAAGDSIFANLGLIFAIGVAIGLAKGNHGAAALAGAVAFLVATTGAKALMVIPDAALTGLAGDMRALTEIQLKEDAIGKLNVPLGILCGVVAGILYNRYSNIRLPEYLAFFGGKRFVPIAAGLAGLILALGFGFGWQLLEQGMNFVSRIIIESGEIGLFAYGVLNRLLIVTGLHHILNNVAWFLVGEYEGVTGDLRRFFAGDPTAGTYMAGFFPVMMFGLPACCLAMYHAAPSDQRRKVGGLFASMALTSFLTGVTEPIEFTFMFMAPVLYLVHACLTGLSLVLMDLFGAKMGFGFSAGFFDYVLNYSAATRPYLLLIIGPVYGAIYYAVFLICIRAFDLRTPGRTEEVAPSKTTPEPTDENSVSFIEALGGPQNIVALDACMTRLRLEVLNNGTIDADRLTALGAKGVVRPSPTTLQVVMGPMADQLADKINQTLNAYRDHELKPQACETGPSGPPVQSVEQLPDALLPIVAAVGGQANVASLTHSFNRLRLTVKDPSLVVQQGLNTAGARDIVWFGDHVLHALFEKTISDNTRNATADGA